MVKQYTSWMYVIVVSKCHVNLDLNIFVTKKKKEKHYIHHRAQHYL